MRSRQSVLTFFKVGGALIMLFGLWVCSVGEPGPGEGEGSVALGAGFFLLFGLCWLGTAVAVERWYGRQAAEQAHERGVLQAGPRRTAVVTHVELSGTTVNQMPVVLVTVDVDGAEYTKRIVTPPTAVPVPGNVIDVAVDPHDPADIALETVPGFDNPPGVVLRLRPEGEQRSTR